MKTLLLSLVLAHQIAFARSGGVVSNGADQVVKSQAWFLGDSEIKGCITRSPEYSLPQEELEKIVIQSFDLWKRYLFAKNLKGVWPANKPFLNFNFSLNESCQGQEDIRFYFGVADEKIKEQIAEYKNPMGLNHLELYDSKLGKGKGFVWIDDVKARPSMVWSPAEQIISLVLHELGHVYGCDHVGDTIMREDLSTYLTTTTKDKLKPIEIVKFPLGIDHGRELFFTFDRGVFAIYDFNQPEPAALVELFELLHQRKPKGKIIMQFAQGANETSDLADLTMVDYSAYMGAPLKSRGQFRIQFDLGSILDFAGEDNRIFRSVYQGQDLSFAVPGFVVQGKLYVDKESNKTIPIIYARNRGAKEYITLKYGTEEKGMQDFFKAFLYIQGKY